MEQLIAKRYGSALFELAREKGALEPLRKEIAAVSAVIEQDRQLMNLLLHPKVSVKDKIQFMEEVLAERIGPDLMGLIVLTIKKGRQSSLLAILGYCLEEIAKAEGMVKAAVTSAEALDKKQMDAIEKRLSQLVGKTIKPAYNVDASLVGGLLIRIGDRILDNTVKGKMHHMSRELLTKKFSIQQ